jgi:hypothetical protein
MKNKTALQELMDWMIKESQVIPVDPEYVYDKAKELLAKEKEQIKEAFKYGEMPVLFINFNAEQYYNETYGKQDE